MATADAQPPIFWSRRKLVIFIAGVILLGVIATALLPLTIIFVAQPIGVQGIGMSPTLNDGDRIFVGKRVGHLQRGDIVIFYYPKDQSKSYIKRVVGLPGEVIELRGGKTFINGSPLDEPYLDPDRNKVVTDTEPVRIAEEHYFVMGDNRDNSSDSRFWGTVPKSLVYGKVIGRYWPLG